MTEQLDEHGQEFIPEPCAAETRPATFYDPPEFCENDAQEGSEFCYWHDPDGAELDAAEARAEALREEGRL